MVEHSEDTVVILMLFIIVFRMLGVPKLRMIPALGASYHPVSLLHFNPVWTVLLYAKRDGITDTSPYKSDPRFPTNNGGNLGLESK